MLLPASVELSVNENNAVLVKGPKGELVQDAHPSVQISSTMEERYSIEITATGFSDAKMHSGTVRAICYNMVHGVVLALKEASDDWCSYRAALQKKITLTVGKSHPDVYELPEGITAECPSQTEIVKGVDKQLVEQVG